MEKVTMSYDGYELEDILTIVGVPKREITKKGKSKKIEVKFYISSEDLEGLEFVDLSTQAVDEETTIQAKRELLGKIFNPKDDKEKKLTFSDEPDRYYLARLSDSSSLEGFKTSFDTGTLEFEVPDGTAHSNTYKKFTNYEKYVDKIKMPITNNGAVAVKPIITIRFKDENGWIGIVNELGVFEAGSKSESDTTLVKRDEKLLDFYGKSGEKVSEGLAKAKKNVGIVNDTPPLVSDIGEQTVWDRKHLHILW